MKSIPISRSLSITTIESILRSKIPLQAAIHKSIEASQGIDTRDVALLNTLVYGYLRNKLQLEEIIKIHSTGFKGLPRPAFIAAAIAVFEIIYCSKIPSYASISWCVEYIKQKYGKKLSGYINAVLRSIDRQEYTKKCLYSLFAVTWANLSSVSKYYSCPKWILDLLLKSIGPEQTKCFLSESVRPMASSIRYNPIQSDISSEMIHDNSYENNLCSSLSRKEIQKQFNDGLFSYQSYSNQVVISILEKYIGILPIIDLFCGTGNKSLYYLERHSNLILSCDIDVKKLRVFQDQCSRLNITRQCIIRQDSNTGLSIQPEQGLYLVDVPCSGLGVIRKRPDIKWNRTSNNVNEIIQLQKSILSKTFQFVPTRSYIAYITCTPNRDENIQVLHDLPKEAHIVEQLSSFSELGTEEYIWCTLIHKYI